MRDLFTEKRPETKQQSRSLKHTKAFLLFDMMANMAIDAAGGKDSVFGRKPQVADYVPTDLGAEAKRATASNISNMPEIQALLEKILPGYGSMVEQGSKNTISLLRGEIPQDVQDQIRRTAAFKSLSGGFGGSGMAKTLTARDLGLTSLDLMGKGENSAQRWAGITEGAVAPFSITAKEQADQTMRNNLYRQATEQFKFNVLASPDPGAAGLFNTIAAIGGSVLGAFSGGGLMPSSRGTTPAATSGVGGGWGGG